MGVSVGDIVGGGLGIAQTAIGLINSNNAKNKAAELEKTRPVAQASPEIADNLNLAESELQGGMGSRAARAYEQQSDKAISSSLAAILKGGGNLNNIGDLYGAGDEGRLRLSQIQDTLRLNQINNAVAARRDKAAEEDKLFEFNQWRPWADKAQAVSNARTGADAQIWNGLQTVGSTFMNRDQQNREDKMYNDYLNKMYAPAKPVGNGNQFPNMPDINVWQNYNPYGGSDYYQSSQTNQYQNYG